MLVTASIDNHDKCNLDLYFCDNLSEFKIEEDIIKQAKKVSITIDQDVWENFSTLATNISQKKGPLLTEILKEYLLKHRDLY